ncbi:MAG: ATP-dependent helicase [Candidatus Sulfotelmatobacter sp.]
MFEKRPNGPEHDAIGRPRILQMTKNHTPKYMRMLNAQQRLAVSYGLTARETSETRPVLILAGAGSGKTKTLALRAVRMIARGIKPTRILMLSFTTLAAKEIMSAVSMAEAARPGRKTGLPCCGTFHAIGAKLYHQYAAEMGLHRVSTILDRSDAGDLMNLVRKDLGYTSQQPPFPRKEECVAINSFVLNSGLSLQKVLSTRFQSCAQWERKLSKLFRAYTAAKRKQRVLDYDDLLVYWLQMMENKKIGAEIVSRFDQGLVDEYQDTNSLQAQILFKLRPGGRGLTVVGDDAQAIYSFRAATVGNILHFGDDCGSKVKTITLEQNYRSVQPIVGAANAVMSLAREGYPKKLFSKRQSKRKPRLTTVVDDKAQARYVVQQILAAKEAGVPFSSQATLFRDSGQSKELEVELAQRGIPFVKFGGRKFFDAPHLKDIICVLRWCENPRDKVAGLRALQLVPGIGPGTAAKILKNVKRRSGMARAMGESW